MSTNHAEEDQKLIKAYQNGDNSAFVALYKKYCGYTNKSLQYKGVAQADAEDLAQEIWTAMLTALKSFQFRSIFKFFLDRAIRNRFINYIQRTKRDRQRFVNRLFEDQAESQEDEINLLERLKGTKSEESDQDLMYHELLDVLQKCLQAMTHKLMRAAVVLRLEGLKIRQIAESLKSSFSNANGLMTRGMGKLRDCVARSYSIQQP